MIYKQWAVLAGCVLLFFSGDSPGDGVQRVLIAGDSTASSYPAVRAPQTGWGQVLGFFLSDDVAVVNRAVSGRSTKSFIDEGKWAALIAQVQPGDVVLISFGHNDSRDDALARYTRPAGEFRDNLVRFARDVIAKEGVPVILSPAARRLWEGPAMVETHGLYALNAKIAAEQAPADFIDLANLSIAYFESVGREQSKSDFLWLTPPNTNARFPEGVEDNTHFSALGACGVARVIALALSKSERTDSLVDPAKLGERFEPGTHARPAKVIECEAATEWLPDDQTSR